MATMPVEIAEHIRASLKLRSTSDLQEVLASGDLIGQALAKGLHSNDELDWQATQCFADGARQIALDMVQGFAVVLEETEDEVQFAPAHDTAAEQYALNAIIPLVNEVGFQAVQLPRMMGREPTREGAKQAFDRILSDSIQKASEVTSLVQEELAARQMN